MSKVSINAVVRPLFPVVRRLVFSNILEVKPNIFAIRHSFMTRAPCVGDILGMISTDMSSQTESYKSVIYACLIISNIAHYEEKLPSPL